MATDIPAASCASAAARGRQAPSEGRSTGRDPHSRHRTADRHPAAPATHRRCSARTMLGDRWGYGCHQQCPSPPCRHRRSRTRSSMGPARKVCSCAVVQGANHHCAHQARAFLRQVGGGVLLARRSRSCRRACAGRPRAGLAEVLRREVQAPGNPGCPQEVVAGRRAATRQAPASGGSSATEPVTCIFCALPLLQNSFASGGLSTHASCLFWAVDDLMRP